MVVCTAFITSQSLKIEGYIIFGEFMVTLIVRIIHVRATLYLFYFEEMIVTALFPFALLLSSSFWSVASESL